MGGGYFSNAFGFLIETLFGIIVLIVMLRFILQLVRADFYNPLSQFVVRATQPVLAPMRRVIPGLGGVDASSVVLMLALKWVELALIVVVVGRHPAADALSNLPVLALSVWAVADLVQMFIYVFMVALLIQVVMSWVSPGTYNAITGLLHAINEPLLRPARRALPPFSGIDFSPLVVFVVLNLALILLVAPLRDLATRI